MLTVISLVSYPFLPAKTGGQKGIAFFYRYFSRCCRLVCLTTRKNDPAAATYTVINGISNSPLRYINIFLFFKLRKSIRKEQASHLLLEHPYYGWLGVLLKRASGVKLVVHSHNIEYQRWKGLGKWWWRVLAAYEKYTHHKADYNFFKTDEDKASAIKKFGLRPEKCATVTYGIEWNQAPALEEHRSCKLMLQQQYGITGGDTIFLFNGSLDYAPNLAAVNIILNKINPLLLQASMSYKIIICGKGLPAAMHELKAYAGKNIIYAGFVDDIGMYFKGADVFINPVIEGGGIQTKLVEALGYNLYTVTTTRGATGIPLAVTGDKMSIIKDDNWDNFAAAMMAPFNNTDIPVAFFNHFYWENIAAKAYEFIADC